MSEAHNPLEIINAIEGQLKKVNTQSLDLSFNELLDMKTEGELDISPEYQRLFRWSEGARSRFIESLLLEMPVPPIYVIEEIDSADTLEELLKLESKYIKKYDATIIIIAHKKTTTENVDLIIYLDDGMVRDIGDPKIIFKKSNSEPFSNSISPRI